MRTEREPRRRRTAHFAAQSDFSGIKWWSQPFDTTASPIHHPVRTRMARRASSEPFLLFADVDLIRPLSNRHFVPIIVDGSAVVQGSWRIAVYLEVTFPGKRRPDPAWRQGRPRCQPVCQPMDGYQLALVVRRPIYPVFLLCLAPEDRAYFSEPPRCRSCTRDSMLSSPIDQNGEPIMTR
jgi:hypothetical protein